MLLRLPFTWSWLLPSVVAVVSTGKFCRLLAPVSASPASLAVTRFVSPDTTRSMPVVALPYTLLPRIRTLV